MLSPDKERQYYIPMLVAQFWLSNRSAENDAFLAANGLGELTKTTQAYIEKSVTFQQWCNVVEHTFALPEFPASVVHSLTKGLPLTVSIRWGVIMYHRTISEAFKYIVNYNRTHTVVPIRLYADADHLRLEFQTAGLSREIKLHTLLCMNNIRRILLDSLAGPPITIKVCSQVTAKERKPFEEIVSSSLITGDSDFIQIDQVDADRSFALANDQARVLTLQVLEQYYGHVLRPGDLVRAVLTNITSQIASGVTTLETIARAMGMGSRTLQRRLQREQVQFSALVDIARYAIYESLVAEGKHSKGQIAQALGYWDTNSLYRAEARWRSQAND